MHIFAGLTYLWTIATVMNAVEGLTPNVDRLHVSKKLDADGNPIRKPGLWKDADFFESVFNRANEMITCLHQACQGYKDTTQPLNKALLDKFYSIENNQVILDSVCNNFQFLATTNNLMVFGDEYGDRAEPAYVAKETIEGKEVWGIFFTKMFSNKRPRTRRLSSEAQAMVLVHESIHALWGKGRHGDYVRLRNSKKECEFLSVTEYRAWVKQAKEDKDTPLLKSLHTVYWRAEYMKSWDAVASHCPHQMMSIPDATMAAGYQCLHGHHPDLRGIRYW